MAMRTTRLGVVLGLLCLAASCGSDPPEFSEAPASTTGVAPDASTPAMVSAGADELDKPEVSDMMTPAGSTTPQQQPSAGGLGESVESDAEEPEGPDDPEPDTEDEMPLEEASDADAEPGAGEDPPDEGTDTDPGEVAPVEEGGDGQASMTPACSSGCMIADTCHSAGAPAPDNPCQHCDPDQSTTAWSYADGNSCDDGLYCTAGDACSQGSCTGQPRVCDDGVACNGSELCDESTDECVPGASACGADESCDVNTDTCSSNCAGCVIDGSCYAAGAVSPGNPCLACNPSLSTGSWSATAGASCNDGDLCTEGDTCNASGQCAGTPKVCADDTDTCGATRACNGSTGQCVETFAGTNVMCDDGDGCTVNDRCDGQGECEGNPMDCGDGNDCTSDSCVGGSCVNEVQGNACLIEGTGCVADGAVSPQSPCMQCDSSEDKHDWTEQTNSCVINNQCYANGAVNPTHACLSCNTASNTNDWTVAGNSCFYDNQCGPCCTDPTSKNVLNNPGFTTSTSGWTVSPQSNVWASDDEDECSASGSVLLDGNNISQCTNVGDETYYFGYSYKRKAGGALNCQITAATALCGQGGTSFFGGAIVTPVAPNMDDDQWFAEPPISINGASGILSMTLTCSGDTGGGYIDQVYFSEGSSGF